MNDKGATMTSETPRTEAMLVEVVAYAEAHPSMTVKQGAEWLINYMAEAHGKLERELNDARAIIADSKKWEADVIEVAQKQIVAANRDRAAAEAKLAAANAERDRWKASHSFYSFRPHFITGTACALCGAEHATYAESHECAIVSATDLKKKVKRTEFLFHEATGYTADEYTEMIKEIRDTSRNSMNNGGAYRADFPKEPDHASDTPRVDALAEQNKPLDNLEAHNRMLDFARTLERELNEAQAKLAALQAPQDVAGLVEAIKLLSKVYEDGSRPLMAELDPDRVIDALLSLSAQLAARDTRIAELVRALDNQHGTPCEQIRNKQREEELMEQLAEKEAECEGLRELLREVMAEGVEHEAGKYALVQMSHLLRADIRAAIDSARKP